jgi:AraC-like DNA-binding protein/ligand-binding sensor protein
MLFQRLAESERFHIYQNAFRCATGLPLRLVSADTDSWCLDENAINRSPFCEKLNICNTACGACVSVNRRLMKEADVKGPSTCHCFAGLAATAVPVKLGASTVAYLKTGQVFSRTPDETSFEKVLSLIGTKTISKKQQAALRDAYFQTRMVDPERYQSMVTLLASFGEQLSDHCEQLSIIDQGAEPEMIAKAKKYIHGHLDQALTLGQVARVAGLSESHFCRMFKDATQMTLTDYVNRCRVEWAKRELLNPAARISEIAFQIGYQSLSQFNRSFARIVGTSPTLYRKMQLGKLTA